MMSYEYSLSRVVPTTTPRSTMSSMFSTPMSLGMETVTRTIRTNDSALGDITGLHGPSAGRHYSSSTNTFGDGPRAATYTSETIGGGGPSYFSTASYKSPYGNNVRMASCPGMSHYLPK